MPAECRLVVYILMREVLPNRHQHVVCKSGWRTIGRIEDIAVNAVDGPDSRVKQGRNIVGVLGQVCLPEVAPDGHVDHLCF